MCDSLNQYFIAITLPQNVADEVTVLKQDFAERFESEKALKVLPHITLKAPFRFPEKQHKHLMTWFTQTPVSVKPFQLELENFGSFANRSRPVIFIQPLITEPLVLLQKQVIQHFKASFPKYHVEEREFNPHVTVAYRDLKPAMFRLAWKEYQSKPFNAKFSVNNFHLLQHDGKKWNTIHEFIL